MNQNQQTQNYTGVIRIGKEMKNPVILTVDEFILLDFNLIHLSFSDANKLTKNHFESIEVVITAINPNSKISLKLLFSDYMENPTFIIPGNIIRDWIKSILEFANEWDSLQIGYRIKGKIKESFVISLFFDTNQENSLLCRAYSAKQILEMLEFTIISIYRVGANRFVKENFSIKRSKRNELRRLIQKRIDKIKNQEALSRIAITFTHLSNPIQKEYIFTHPELYVLYLAFMHFIEYYYNPLIEIAIESNNYYQVNITENGIETVIK